MTTVCPTRKKGSPFPGPHWCRYTSYLMLEMNIGVGEEVILKFEAGTEQRRVLMRGRHK